ncbi:hypothetical protein [Streptomyces sp. RerS4]|uniref:hypothetical protein n=1 Tax=Streptomyces sp. RerS4 TaxID=2942449 RepID=UPI00201C0F15|nr:hypothetical protein [Streptomyces sp. RerS4]UQX04398.1 hypothetical protein M4D82_30760 [Streptomyces sp. RerS4]
MDYQKVDPALGIAMDAEGRDPSARDLTVLVRLTEPPSPDQLEQLRRAGVESASGPDVARTVLTGTLSREDVETLADQPWVRSLSLSATRRPT